MELQMGQLVFSRKGRDCGRVYMVLAQEGERVLLVNGGKRPLDEPKRKNIRHINPTGRVLPAGQYATDQQLKAALEAYEAEIQPPTSGG